VAKTSSTSGNSRNRRVCIIPRPDFALDRTLWFGVVGARQKRWGIAHASVYVPRIALWLLATLLAAAAHQLIGRLHAGAVCPHGRRSAASAILR
jgi:hypothetical protein